MRSSMRYAAFAALLVTVAIAAQVRENVTVELIEVPVYVTGAGGEPVRGLTKENFELRVNGKEQAIEYFDAIDFAAPRDKSDGPRPARERHLYLFLFDRVYSIRAQLQRAQLAAIDAVEHSNRDTDLFAVATNSANKGIQFATPFLSDRVAIVRAIGTLNVAGLRDPLGLSITSAERGKWAAAMEDGSNSGFVAGSRGDEPDREMASAIRGGAAFQDMSAQPARNTIQDVLGNFGDLAKRLAALEGQKHLVLFSRGFNTDLLYGTSATAANVTSGGGIDGQAILVKKAMVNTFRAAGVFIDTIDIGGMRHTGPALTDTAPAAHAFTSGADESLSSLAHETGGEYVYNRNNLKEAIAYLTNSHRVVYILAFSRQSNRSGSITVHVNGVPHGTNVSYRQGFGEGGPAKDVDPLQLADILEHDVPQTGISLALSVKDQDLFVAIPAREVALQLPPRTNAVEALYYVFDDHGNAVSGGSKSVPVLEGMTVRARLHLKPGHYVAKAIVRIPHTTSLGFARQEFTVE